MTQPTENKTAPSVSLASLKIRSAELAKGIDGLQKNISAAQAQLSRFRDDVIATSGAKQFVDQLIAQEEAEAAKVAEPSAL